MADPAPPIEDKRDEIPRPEEDRRKRLLRSVSISEKDGGALPPEELRKTLGELGVEPTPVAEGKKSEEGEGGDPLPPPPGPSVALVVADKPIEEPPLDHVASRRVSRAMSTNRRPPSVRRDTIGSMRASVSAALAAGAEETPAGQKEADASETPPPPAKTDEPAPPPPSNLPPAEPAPPINDKETESSSTSTTSAGGAAATSSETDNNNNDAPPPPPASSEPEPAPVANGNGAAPVAVVVAAPVGGNDSGAGGSNGGPVAAVVAGEKNRHPSVAAEASARELAEKEVTASVQQLRIDTLKAGQYFMKHGRKGSPHLRFVKLTGDGKNIAYAPAKKGQKPDVSKCKKSIKVADIVRITTGRQTDVFKRDKKAKAGQVELSFSIIARGERTFDLVAENRDHFVQWVDGIRVLLDEPMQCDETFATIKAQVDSRMLNKMINEQPAEKIAKQVPFARVDVVHDRSPADQAGLREGDLVVKLGSVTFQSQQPLAGAGAVVSSSENQTLDVVVLRDGNPLMLTLTPQRWTGQGLLGCALLPWMSRRGSTIGGPDEYARPSNADSRPSSGLAR